MTDRKPTVDPQKVGMTEKEFEELSLLTDAAYETMPFIETLPSLPLQREGERPKTDPLQASQLPQYEQRYIDMGELGRGGVGEIRRVYDSLMQRLVALKVLQERWADNANTIHRFSTEASLTARLQHPGIVPVHEIGKLPDGRIYFTMPIIRGDTLSARLKGLYEQDRVNPGKLRQLIDAFYQACQTIAFVHAEGVVHKDIKPSNIMIGEHGESYVMDWGLAKLLPDMDDGQTQMEGGTPAYIAPELLQNADFSDYQVDVYALGATLYKILCGSHPYQGKSPIAIIHKILKGPPKPLWEWRRGGLRIPADLIPICEKAMARNPEERFPTALELSKALLAWRDGDQRRQEARKIIQKAQAQFQDVVHLRGEARRLRTMGTSMLRRIPKHCKEDEKSQAWKVLDLAETMQERAALTHLEHERMLVGALSHAPDFPDAHEALAQHYQNDLMVAERSRSHRRSVRARELLQQHASALPPNHHSRKTYFSYLDGAGTLRFETTPQGAQVIIEEYEVRNRRLIAVRSHAIGETPLVTPLAMGSYRLRVRHPEHEELLYPIQIDRQQNWSGVPPGFSHPLPIKMIKKGQVGQEDAYIPASWFWSGGPELEFALPWKRIWVDGFVIRRHPVTNAEYIGFLNDLLKQGRQEEALKYAPRERGGAVNEQGALIYGMEDAHFYLRTDADGDKWMQDWPVVMVSWLAAMAYAEWYSQQTNLPWRLPYELEREKASRGVDGRVYPWGNEFDHCWCNTADSLPNRPSLVSITDFPTDVSPYGVRGVTGNVYDWCLNPFSVDGPMVDNGRFIPVPQQGEVKTVMGSCWSSREFTTQAWHRDHRNQADRHYGCGFRLARSLCPADCGEEI
jgi:eukaryotic-like serine/threonine-protein kinase